MLEVVIWDVGGVLLPKAVAHGRERWRTRLGLPVDEFQAAVWEAMGSSGLADTSAIIERLATSMALPEVEAERLLYDFHEHWCPDGPMLAFARDLARERRTAVLANAGAAARWGFEAVLGLHLIASEIVISAEVGVEKPNELIYALLLERLGVAPERCAFIDDRADNVEAALALGIRGIHHTEHETTVRRLTELCNL